MKQRCCNIDWLEVYCIEPLSLDRDAEYFRRHGYVVKKRDYGTPQYKEVLLLYDCDKPCYEIRRLPYSLKCQGGIFALGSCHIRLANRACYAPSAIDNLRRFLILHNYIYRNISRIDICLDFQQFDNLMTPNNVVKKYMKGDISKINQCKVAAHGQDAWDGRTWNSLKWGSQTSSISTKLYNKSLEMREVKRKFYIEDIWKEAGLDEKKDTWRVEFSIKSDIKGYVRLDDGELIDNKLTSYDTPDKLLHVFRLLSARYFHFKKLVYNRNNELQRKDRCPDVDLFKLSFEDKAVKPIKLTNQTEPDRTDKLLAKRLEQIVKDESVKYELRTHAQSLLQYYDQYKRLPSSFLDYLIMKRE